CRAHSPISFLFSAQLRARFASTITASVQRGLLRPVEQAMHTELFFQRKLRRMLVAAAIVGPVALTPEMSAAEGLLDFFFGGGQKQQHQTSSFGDLFNNNPQSPPPRPVVVSAGPAFCVRSCDGKY